MRVSILDDVVKNPHPIYPQCIAEECARYQYLSEDDKVRNKKAYRWILRKFAEGRGVALPPAVYPEKDLSRCYVILSVMIGDDGSLLAMLSAHPDDTPVNISFLPIYYISVNRAGHTVYSVFNDRLEVGE